MHSRYDTLASAKQLEQIVRARKAMGECGTEAMQLHKVAKIFDIMSFEDCDTKGSRKLCVEDEKNGTPVELVVRVSGVLAELELPPRCRPVEPNERIFLRQHVTLTGHGAPSFTTAIEQLELLTQDFHRFFEPNAWKGWSPTTHDQNPTLDANSRFYTQPRSVPGAVDVPFTKDEDPRGFLEGGKDNNFIHTIDNVVEYWEYSTEKNRYIEVDPRSFMEGDMVEAHLSFLVIRLSAKRQLNRALSPASVDNHRMLVVLRGLTRLARNASPIEDKDLAFKSFNNTKRRKLHEKPADDEAMEGGISSAMKKLHFGTFDKA